MYTATKYEVEARKQLQSKTGKCFVCLKKSHIVNYGVVHVIMIESVMVDSGQQGLV